MPTDPNRSLAAPLLVVGAGGHAKVVIEAARLAGLASIHVVDDNPALVGIQVLGIEVAAVVPHLPVELTFHVGIGNNAGRQRKFAELAARFTPATLVHQRASVSASAKLGAGTLVAANAVVGPDALLGEGCIVNHGAVVDHDCRLGAFCHVAPNATLAGDVRLGERVLVGAGANVLPGVRIGDDCVVAAGAVVLHDLASGTTHAGVPARLLDKQGKR